MSEPTDEEIESALADLWTSYIPQPEILWSSLEAAASMGVDISQAPPDSICRISKTGTTFHLLDKEGFPV